MAVNKISILGFRTVWITTCLFELIFRSRPGEEFNTTDPDCFWFLGFYNKLDYLVKHN